MTYEEWSSAHKQYLQSTDWQTLSKSFLERNRTCAICGQRATEVHHLDYKGLDYEHNRIQDDANQLVALCHRCHSLETSFHGTKLNDEKLSQQAINYVLQVRTEQGTKQGLLWLASNENAYDALIALLHFSLRKQEVRLHRVAWDAAKELAAIAIVRLGGMHNGQ